MSDGIPDPAEMESQLRFCHMDLAESERIRQEVATQLGNVADQADLPGHEAIPVSRAWLRAMRDKLSPQKENDA